MAVASISVIDIVENERSLPREPNLLVFRMLFFNTRYETESTRKLTYRVWKLYFRWS
jgi:hypothetical protein